MAFEALSLARILVLAFFAACFLQSGIDKVVDWKGNLGWLTEHFGKTFFRSLVPLLLGTLTVMECLTGLACAFAIVVLLTGGGLDVAIAAMGLACLTFVMLFTGQRIAKDYVGAATLATYFAVALLGLVIMSGPLPIGATP
jgi:hypothetical protein